MPLVVTACAVPLDLTASPIGDFLAARIVGAAIAHRRLDLVGTERNPDRVAGTAILPARILDAVVAQRLQGFSRPVWNTGPGVRRAVLLILSQSLQPIPAADVPLGPLVGPRARLTALEPSSGVQGDVTVVGNVRGVE
ncbi:MAG: hypothetical protein ACK55I_27535, partial [bacterium]